MLFNLDEATYKFFLSALCRGYELISSGRTYTNSIFKQINSASRKLTNNLTNK